MFGGYLYEDALSELSSLDEEMNLENQSQGYNIFSCIGYRFNGSKDATRLFNEDRKRVSTHDLKTGYEFTEATIAQWILSNRESKIIVSLENDSIFIQGECWNTRVCEYSSLESMIEEWLDGHLEY